MPFSCRELKDIDMARYACFDAEVLMTAQIEDANELFTAVVTQHPEIKPRQIFLSAIGQWAVILIKDEFGVPPHVQDHTN